MHKAEHLFPQLPVRRCHLCAVPPASIKEQPVSAAAEAGASFPPRMMEAARVTLHQHDEMIRGLAPNARLESG